jgi:hypothetical protein
VSPEEGDDRYARLRRSVVASRRRDHLTSILSNTEYAVGDGAF